MSNGETVLLIEDDSEIREGIRYMLEAEGFSVEEAANGSEGLAKLREETALIVLDIMMPGMPGLEACREIRKRSYVPVLILTDRSSESDKLIGFRAGADDYLVKPFSHAELVARVQALLRRRQE